MQGETPSPQPDTDDKGTRNRFSWFQTTAADITVGDTPPLHHAFSATAQADFHTYSLFFVYPKEETAAARQVFLSLLDAVTWYTPQAMDAVAGLPFHSAEQACKAILPDLLAEKHTQDSLRADIQAELIRRMRLLLDHGFSFHRYTALMEQLHTGAATEAELWRNTLRNREPAPFYLIRDFHHLGQPDYRLYGRFVQRSWSRLVPLGEMAGMGCIRQETRSDGGTLWFLASHPEPWPGQDSFLLVSLDWQVRGKDTVLRHHHHKVAIPYDGFRTRMQPIHQWEGSVLIQSPHLLLSTVDARYTWAVDPRDYRSRPVFIPEPQPDSLIPDWIARNCVSISDKSVGGYSRFPALWRSEGRFADTIRARRYSFPSYPPPTSDSLKPDYKRTLGEWQHTMEHFLRRTAAQRVIPTRRLYQSRWVFYEQYALRFQVSAGKIHGIQVLEFSPAGPVLLPLAPAWAEDWLRTTQDFRAMQYESFALEHHLIE